MLEAMLMLYNSGKNPRNNLCHLTLHFMSIHECVTVVQLIGMKDTEECLPPFRVPFVPRLRYGRDRSKGIVVTAWTCPMFQDHFSFDFHGCFLKNRQYLNVPNFEFHQRFQFGQQRNVKFELITWKPCPGATAGAKAPRSRVFAVPTKMSWDSHSISWYIMVYWLPLLSLSQPTMVAVGP